MVTTPQSAAAEVAERAGTMASMMHQRVLGVVENMSYLNARCPSCDEVHRYEIFGSGGGQDVADTLSARLGYPVKLLGQIPLDADLRAGGDSGVPLLASDPTNAAALALAGVADHLVQRGRGLAGRALGLTPAGRG